MMNVSLDFYFFFFKCVGTTDLRTISNNVSNSIILCANTLDELFRTRDRTPAICSNDAKVAIPQTQDLRDTCAIKRDLRRRANTEDDQRRQLASLA